MKMRKKKEKKGRILNRGKERVGNQFFENQLQYTTRDIGSSNSSGSISTSCRKTNLKERGERGLWRTDPFHLPLSSAKPLPDSSFECSETRAYPWSTSHVSRAMARERLVCPSSAPLILRRGILSKEIKDDEN